MPRTILAILFVLAATTVSAQDTSAVSFVRDVIVKVVIDPTTYVPAIVGWESTRLDWQSSQRFFRNGWMEQNARFTVSGDHADVPIGYAAGNRQILTDAFTNLQLSLIHNASERVVERLLAPRLRNHSKLLRTIGWVERTALASVLSYQLSANHLRQWQANERLARRLGFE